MGSGGAEKVISLLLKKLVKDYDVTLILFYDIFHFKIPKEVNVEILSTSSLNKNFINKLFDFPKFINRYFRLIKRDGFHVTVSFLTRPNFINGFLKIFTGKDVKVIMSERNYPSIEYKSSFLRYNLYKLLIPWLYSKADILFSNSEWINKDLTENFGVKTKMKVLYNPIILPNNIKLFDSIKKFKKLEIVSVGRLIPTKNNKLLLESISSLKSENLKVNFLGDGILRNSLEEFTKNKDLSSKVKFWGNVKNVSEKLLDFDLFIHTSNSEGFPNALLEAMSVGLPIISTNCMSGPLEILNDNIDVEIKQGDFYIAKYGLLINVNDSVGLTKAIKYFLANQNEFYRFSNLSLYRANRYSLDNIYDEFRNII